MVIFTTRLILKLGWVAMLHFFTVSLTVECKVTKSVHKVKTVL